MGVFTKMGRWLRSDSAHTGSRGVSSRADRASQAVAIDLHAPEPDPDAELDGFDPRGGQMGAEPKPPKSRQELIAELQRNYQEVLGIVRKVDGHLDEQGARSRRLGEIAERFPAAAEDLSGLRAGQEEVTEALGVVASALESRDLALTAGQRATLDRLEEIRGLMAESSEAERQLIGSLVEFRDVMGGMSAATERLSVAVERIEQRESERADRVIEAIRATRSGVYAAAVIAGMCGVVAVVLGLVSLAV